MAQCKKVAYSEKRFADFDINKIYNKSTRDKVPIRSYQCKICNMWHLTSKEPLIKQDWDFLINQNMQLEKQVAQLTAEFLKTQNRLNNDFEKQLRENAKIKALNFKLSEKDKIITKQKLTISDLIYKLNTK